MKTVFGSLIVLILVSAAFSADEYELPDLGVTVTDPSCANAEEFLPIAQGDLEYVMNFQNKIKQQISYLTISSDNLRKSCELSQMDSSRASDSIFLSSMNRLLQLNTRKKGTKSLSQTKYNVEAPGEHASKIEKDIAEKMKTSLALISQITCPLEANNQQEEQVTKSVNFTSNCQNADANIKEMLDELNWVSTQLQKVIDELLPCRINTLKSLIEQCKLHTQTGSWSKTYHGLNHSFEQENADLRSEDYTIIFDEPFAETPSVALSLTGFDIARTHPGIAVTLQDVTKSTFVFRVFSFAESQVFLAQINWIATISAKSGIYVVSDRLDYQEDVEWSQKYNGPTGEKSVNHTIKYIEALKEPAAALGIAGFTFNGSTNARLSVEADGFDCEKFNLVYKTWWDTTLYTAYVFVLYYDKQVGIKGTELQETSTGATLFNGNGERNEEYKTKLTGSCSNKLGTWIGLVKIDIDYTVDYRLKTETKLETDENNQYELSVKFNTWEASKIWSIDANVFYTNTRNE